ncbi:RNA-directed DNA polymerase, eukaryota, reverse transcriptase zinc-binding domain protein, partial [Tanacetum coccineum]
WRHPRGGEESSQFNALLSYIGDVVLSRQKDTWVWSLNSTIGFTVASVRTLIVANTIVLDSNATRWNRSVPIKVNVFLWRLALNKLPTRVILERKGIDIDSTLCSICGEDVETVNHIFFSCETAKDLWALLARWWSLDIPICSNFLDWSTWLDSLHLSSKEKLFLEGVGGALLWTIWNFRNRLIFSVPPPKKAVLWDIIVTQSFLWISSRNPKLKFSWVGWIQHPLVSIASMVLDEIEARYGHALARGNYEISYVYHLTQRCEIMVRTYRDWYTACDYYWRLGDGVRPQYMSLTITPFDGTEHRRAPHEWEIIKASKPVGSGSLSC